MKITEKQKDYMLHALGVPKFPKNWKAKTILNKCYRNRYVVYKKEKELDDLVNKGLMDVIMQRQSSVNDKMYFYYVTEKGVEWLKASHNTCNTN